MVSDWDSGRQTACSPSRPIPTLAVIEPSQVVRRPQRPAEDAVPSVGRDVAAFSTATWIESANRDVGRFDDTLSGLSLGHEGPQPMLQEQDVEEQEVEEQ